SVEDTQKKVESFQDKLLGFIDASRKTSESLNNELTNGFKKFGEGIQSNFQETVSSLADIVVNAQDRIKEIRKELSETDLSDDQRSQLQKELKEQQAILKSREDFEERQAERITAIREKLTENGIDAEQAGLDG